MSFQIFTISLGFSNVYPFLFPFSVPNSDFHGVLLDLTFLLQKSTCTIAGSHSFILASSSPPLTSHAQLKWMAHPAQFGPINN